MDILRSFRHHRVLSLGVLYEDDKLAGFLKSIREAEFDICTVMPPTMNFVSM